MSLYLKLIIAVACIASQASAATWYSDPINGSTPSSSKDVGKGDGSRTRPWGSFESLVRAKLFKATDPLTAVIKPGDTVKLMSGPHGRISFQSGDFQNSETITVEADDDALPVISQLSVKFAQKWRFRRITFQCPEKIEARFMLLRGVMVSGFDVEECLFQSTGDATTWTDEDWSARCAQFGLWLSGADIKISRNRFYAVENCIAIEGRGFLVDGNQCEYFLNDGIQHAASDVRITGNRIVDQYNLEENVFHHDAIQGWTKNDLTNTNVVIEGNFIARSTGKYTTIPPISDSVFQGITIFDGKFSGVTVANNVVMSPAYHAISLYGCVDSTIQNNTVIYQGMTPNKPCWIGVMIGKPKWDAVEPKNILVKNNIAPTYALTKSKTGITIENNFSFRAPNKPWNTSFTIVDPAKTFTKYEPVTATFDLSVRDDSPAAGKVVVTRVNPAGARQ